jgi:hypothetical protein
MSSILNRRLRQRSFLMRVLQTTGLSLALMTASAAGVHAADDTETDIEVGATGALVFGDGFGDIPAGPGQPAFAGAAASSATGNATATATATGGEGGMSIGENDDSPGGDAFATSTAKTTGSGDATSTANATGGDIGDGGFNSRAIGGSATATADALATGGGKAIATAVATGGGSDEQATPFPTANATSNAATAQGGMAQALSTTASPNDGLQSTAFQATAATSFEGVSVSVQSNAMGVSGFGAAEAIAQGGSGQTFAHPGDTIFAAATALPDKAYATTLIGGASNVADALLGPGDEIFGTALLFGGSATFNFNFSGRSDPRRRRG